MIQHERLLTRKPSNFDGEIARLLHGDLLDQVLATFLVTKQAEGAAVKTLRNYQSFLGRFATWVAAEGYPTADLAALQAPHLLLFLDTLRQGGAMPATIHAYGRALHTFFNFLVDEGHLAKNPMDGPRPGKPRVPLPRVPEPRITPFTEAQIEALLKQCDLATALGCRNAALILLMLDTGLRASEVCGLELARYTPVTGQFSLQGAKGGGERVAVLSPTARRAVARWLAWRAVYGAPPDTLFIALGGRAPAPLTPNGLYICLAKLGRAAGLEGVRCSPHTLRHTFACWWIQNGGDMESLRQLMGHTTVRMTVRYLHLRGEALTALHRAHAPASRLNPAAVGRGHRAPGEAAPVPARPGERPCSVPGCAHPVKARGWCDGHYKRWELTGDVQAHIPLQTRAAPVERLCERCEKPINPASLRTHPEQRYCNAACARAARYGAG